MPTPRHPEPTVILVHGLVISSLYMIPTARLLAPLYRVLAPDLPGFGESEKPREVLSVAQLADALGDWIRSVVPREVVLVGNSLGCQVIAELVSRGPAALGGAALRGIILAGPTMDPGARSAPRQIGRWLHDWIYESPSMAAAHLRDYVKAGPRRAWVTFRHALRHPIEERLPLLPAPTLVVRGARDPIVPQRWAEEATALLPEGELLVMPGAPHVVNYTAAEAFSEVVHAFIQGLSRS